MSLMKARAMRETVPVQDSQPDQRLMCSATGCPNLWSTSIGHLCRWHAEAQPHDWPAVTAQQQWHETDRALQRNEPKPERKPLTAADKRAILLRLNGVGQRMRNQPADPKAWAKVLKTREEAGDRLTAGQRQAWRQALHHHGETTNAEEETT